MIKPCGRDSERYVLHTVMAERVGLLRLSCRSPFGAGAMRRPKSLPAILSNPLAPCSWARIPRAWLDVIRTLIRAGRLFEHNWRRGWDSNPRIPVKILLEFQSSAFDRSATSPLNELRDTSRSRLIRS